MKPRKPVFEDSSPPPKWLACDESGEWVARMKKRAPAQIRQALAIAARHRAKTHLYTPENYKGNESSRRRAVTTNKRCIAVAKNQAEWWRAVLAGKLRPYRLEGTTLYDWRESEEKS